MKKMWKKLVVISFAVVLVFLGGVFVFQHLSEKALAEKSESEILPVDWSTINEQTLAEYYRDGIGYSDEILQEFAEKFDLDIHQTTVGDLTSEQSFYLEALIQLRNYPDAPILARNEVPSDDEDYLMSLETMVADAMAMAEEDDSESVIEEILEKHQIDPDGLVKDLNVEIILEINNALYEASSHPK